MGAQATFETLARRFRTGAWTAESNRLTDSAPLEPGDIQELPPLDSTEYRALEQRGQQALEAAQVGTIIVAGGMGTRFDTDQPKALYPILDDKSLLQLKVEWLLAVSPKLSIFIMTSFHSDAAIRAHARERGDFGAAPGQIRYFMQNTFPRLTQAGERFKPEEPSKGFAPPGHGDFIEVFQREGLLDEFRQSGGRYLYYSNLDNLGATLEPAIIGWHIRSGCEMTIEVAAKWHGDKGGAPARVGGRVQLVEGFAFPADFDQDSIPVFNTASYVFTADALARPHDLPWYVVEKQVDGEPVIQFERLAGDLSRTLTVGLLAIDRDERFIPVKSQSDVPMAQAFIRSKCSRF